MRNLIMAGCLFGCLLASPAYAIEQVTPKEKADFLALETKLWDAWNARLHPADAAPFYSKAPGNIYFDLSPLKFTGWAEYERTASAALKSGGTAKTTINPDFTVIRNGDLAVTAFTFKVQFHMGGSVNGFEGRETDVWAKENGKWQIVHQHMSTPMRAAEPAK